MPCSTWSPHMSFEEHNQAVILSGFLKGAHVVYAVCARLDLFEAVRTSNPSMCFYILVKAFQMNAHDINIKKSEHISHKHH